MKKRLALIALLVLIALALFGCAALIEAVPGPGPRSGGSAGISMSRGPLPVFRKNICTHFYSPL